MEPTDVLASVAELAVAFAGFSGIVAALGRRDEGAVFPEDRIRLAVLIGASLSTAAFALLPLALWEVVDSPARVWSIASIRSDWMLTFANSPEVRQMEPMGSRTT